MKKTGPTDDQVAALADAMCMVLNDLSAGGGVCDLVQATARIAFEPFLMDDNGELPDLEWAWGVVRSCDRPSATSATQ
jgi:hypothetical protein